MQVRQFVDKGLGNSTHLAISERAGAGTLIGPLRDVDRYPRCGLVHHVELRPAFAVWVGSVGPFGARVILVSDTTDSRDEAVHQLIQIG